jgi:superfamily II DNA or RNA helicase
MPRSLIPWEHPLRDWQQDANEIVIRKVKAKEQDALLVATPASGKTRTALRFAHKLYFMHYIKRIVAVVPTEHLKKQWAEDAHLYGIDLDPMVENRIGKEGSDYHGVVLTYAQLGMDADIHKHFTDSTSTLVILDEIHHAGESKTWGDALRTAFENAFFRLALSGTPFRRDNNPIPFVKYVNDVSVSDYVYSYQQAVEDNVCRAIYFPAYDGIMEWKTDGVTYRHNFEEQISQARESERLRTALDPDGEFMKQFFLDADKKLNEIRRGNHPDAGGLVLAIDQEHAARIKKMIFELIGESPIIAVSDDKNASKHIKEYKRRKDKWLVSVKMISEGVDIPRLRVGVYATNVESELFFRQVTGRFIRVLAHLKSQDAYLYIPKRHELVRFAREIEQERDHALNTAKEKYDKDLFGKEIEPREKEQKDFKVISAEVTGTMEIKTNFTDKISTMFGLPKAKAAQIAQSVVQQPTEAEIPVFEKIKTLRKEINDLAMVYAKNRGNGSVDWQLGHKDWIKLGGRSIELETMPELLRRRRWLQNNLQKS